MGKNNKVATFLKNISEEGLEQSIYLMQPPLENNQYVKIYLRNNDSGKGTFVFGCNQFGEVVNWANLTKPSRQLVRAETQLAKLGYRVSSEKTKTKLNTKTKKTQNMKLTSAQSRKANLVIASARKQKKNALNFLKKAGFSSEQSVVALDKFVKNNPKSSPRAKANA
jgi:hypothetical protein